MVETQIGKYATLIKRTYTPLVITGCVDGPCSQVLLTGAREPGIKMRKHVRA